MIGMSRQPHMIYRSAEENSSMSLDRIEDAIAAFAAGEDRLTLRQNGVRYWEGI